MRATDRVEGSIDAWAVLVACGDPAHGRHEVSRAIVDRGCAEALDGLCKDSREGPLYLPLHPAAERFW